MQNAEQIIQIAERQVRAKKLSKNSNFQNLFKWRKDFYFNNFAVDKKIWIEFIRILLIYIERTRP